MAIPILTRAFSLGLATGSRSQSGLAALAWSAPHAPTLAGVSWNDPLGRRAHGRVGTLLASRWARTSTAVALAGELVGDKLPSAPARNTPAPLAARLVLGALGGYALAEREGASRLTAALAGVLGSAVTTLLGAKYRALAAAKIPQLGPLPRDLPAALAEDVFTISVALAATRR